MLSVLLRRALEGGLALVVAGVLTTSAAAQNAPPADTTAAPADTTASAVSETRASDAAPAADGVLSNRIATIPLPNNRGAFYFRSGTPGGVRIGSRPASAAAPTAEAARMRPAERAALARARETQGLSRLDLAELRRALNDDLDRKFNEMLLNQLLLARDRPDLFRSGDGRAPFYLVPGEDGSLVLQRGEPDAAQGFAPSDTSAAGATGVPGRPGLDTAPTATPRTAPLPGSVREIERALLDTGLFRSIGVNFEFNRAELMPSSRRVLDNVADVLRRYPQLRIGVAGHTDSIGSDAYNQALSQRRAEAVRTYFLETYPDLDPSRLEARGFGESRPIAENTNPTGRTLNRRVEFIVLNPEDTEGIVSPQAVDGEPPEGSLDAQIRRILREEIERARDGG